MLNILGVSKLCMSKWCYQNSYVCLTLSCPEPVLLGRKKIKERMHNKTPCSRLFRMHLWLHCIDVSSRLHMLKADETPCKKRGLLMIIPISQKVIGTLRGLASILKNLFFYVSMLVQCTGKVLCCPSSFFLYINSNSKICLERQTICKIFSIFFQICKISEIKSGPLYCPSEYAVTLFPVL